MNTRNIFTKLSIVLALVAIPSTITIWQVRRTGAQQTQSTVRQARLSALNVTRGQSLRLSVANINSPELPPDPCRVRLGFLDASGNVLRDPRTGEAIRRTIIVQNGQSTSLMLNGDDFVTGDAIGAGTQLRPFVISQVAASSDGTVPPDPCAPLVEVIDNTTAKSSFVYAGSERMGLTAVNHNETLVRDRSRQ